MGGEVEEAADVVLVVEFAPIVVAGPSLGPDQIDGGAGPVLPAEDQVGAEFQEVEIGIPESDEFRMGSCSRHDTTGSANTQNIVHDRPGERFIIQTVFYCR